MNPINLKKDYKNRDLLDYLRWDQDQAAIEAAINKFVSSITEGDSGADNLKMSPIEDISSADNVQTFLRDLVNVLINSSLDQRLGIVKALSKIDGTGGSAIVGSKPTGGLVGATVYEQLINLRKAIDQITAGQIPVGTIDSTKLSAEVNSAISSIGNASLLTTDDKDTLVDAINEVNAKAGVTANLKTVNKTSLVGAVNEIKSGLTSYAAATGSANAYAISLNPVPTSIDEGFSVAVKINADSTGASTLNVNGLGAKPIKKATGTDATNLKANGIYTMRYDGANFILQGEGSSGGNAVASDLRLGKTATTDAGEIVGTFGKDIDYSELGMSAPPAVYTLYDQSKYAAIDWVNKFVYIANTYPSNNVIKQFDFDGNLKWTAIHDSSGGGGAIVFMKVYNGILHYTASSGTLWQASQAGVLTMKISVGYSFYAFDFDKFGNIYLAHHGPTYATVKQYTPEFVLLQTQQLAYGPTALKTIVDKETADHFFLITGGGVSGTVGRVNVGRTLSYLQTSGYTSMVFIAVDSVNHFLYCWGNNKLVKLNYNFTLQWEVSLTLPGGLDTNGNNAITVLPSGEILLYSMSRFELRSAVNGTLLKAWANTRTDTTLSNASKVHIMENPNSPNEYGIVIAGLSNAEGNGITQIFKRKFNLA